jgi:hypothetical protein
VTHAFLARERLEGK